MDLPNERRLEVGDVAQSSRRHHTVLVEDVSVSMPIDALNTGRKLLFRELQKDKVVSEISEMSEVDFADDARVVLDCAAIKTLADAPELQQRGSYTDVGAGVSLGLELIRQRESFYIEQGLDFFAPFLLILSDGQPNHGCHLTAARECCELEAEGRLLVLPVGIGPKADLLELARFSKKQDPIRIEDASFGRFFQLVSTSIRQASAQGCDEPFNWDEQECGSWDVL